MLAAGLFSSLLKCVKEEKPGRFFHLILRRTKNIYAQEIYTFNNPISSVIFTNRGLSPVIFSTSRAHS
jgi:hypothetical protein